MARVYVCASVRARREDFKRPYAHARGKTRVYLVALSGLMGIYGLSLSLLASTLDDYPPLRLVWWTDRPTDWRPYPPSSCLCAASWRRDDNECCNVLPLLLDPTPPPPYSNSPFNLISYVVSRSECKLAMPPCAARRPAGSIRRSFAEICPNSPLKTIIEGNTQWWKRGGCECRL